MEVAVVKYNAGNVFSVKCALKRIGVEAVVTDDVEQLKRADKVVFPGVGEASTAMDYLRSHGLDRVIADLKQPVLGICIGLQLLCRSSEEGNTHGIGVFDLDVKRFASDRALGLKIPHMGWNTISVVKNNPLLDEKMNGAWVYYVHSYYAPVGTDTIATTEYGNDFSAALQKNNFFATQFHPEKSGTVGEQVLKNFVEL